MEKEPTPFNYDDKRSIQDNIGRLESTINGFALELEGVKKRPIDKQTPFEECKEPRCISPKLVAQAALPER